MLKELQVKNFAIIDDAVVKFEKGLNILTGETGAGKTLIIEAINLLIGERAESTLIRENEEKLIVQGYFDFSKNKKALNFLIKEKLIEPDDKGEDIVISREVNRVGRNRSFINGVFTQVSTLKKLGGYFIDIHGQHDHQYLLETSTHIEVVDKFGKGDLENIKKNYKDSLKNYINIKEKLEKLINLKNEKDERLFDLKYRLDEIEKLNLGENDEIDLENELRVLKNYEKIYNLSSECINIIKGAGDDITSFEDNAAVIEKNFVDLSKIDTRFKKYIEEISSVVVLVDEISHFLKTYTEDLEYSSDRIDYIHERLYKINEIKKKYNIDFLSIKKLCEKLREEINNFESIDKEIEKKQAEFDKGKDIVIENAVNLSEFRKKVIAGLEEDISRELLDLNFKSVIFKVLSNYIKGDNGVVINSEKVKLGDNGIDNIEFLISLNLGESMKPLRKIISGGEISRIMLALKSIISSVDNITTMIFDEIDAGIGGETSVIIGKKLYKISKNCQVVCITHLPQIASFSNTHYFIDKFIEKNRTKIKIRKLDNNGKIKEISRMSSGSEESDISILHAEELLEKSNRIKKELIGEQIKIGN
jgi:DNA repair protein RecN (Recombination protein N)